MHVLYRRRARLPKLAWCAAVDQRQRRVVVTHGTSVEVRDRFFVEGAWNGDFARGDFGSTDAIFGSGGVVSPRAITFVTSCSTTDPLFYVNDGVHVVVSNSLPFLLAETGDALDPHYEGYFEDCESVIDGIDHYRRSLVTRNGTVTRLLYRNLRVGNGHAEEVDKQASPRFAAYEDYSAYLEDQYRRLVTNIRAGARSERIDILSTQSRGYDSTAVNAIASRHGIDRVFTASTSKSVDAFGEQRNRGFQNDDGSEICRVLGLECVPIDRRHYQASGFPDEYLYYASQPGNQDANLLEINTHIRRTSVLLTGVLGELWYGAALYASRPGYITPSLKRFDSSGHGLSEVRLRAGFIQLAFPFLGARQRPDIFRITNSPEMDPWRVNPDYDRPIPRRIAEERGVPRALFGQQKMGSVVLFPSPRLPHNRQLRREFLDALIEQGVIDRWQARAWPAVHVLNTILDRRSTTRFRPVYYLGRAIEVMTAHRCAFSQLWSSLNGSLFCYCTNKCVDEYAAWLRDAADEDVDSRHDVTSRLLEAEQIAAE